MLHETYETDMEEHRKLLAAYLAGITGELAASLVEGQPCPVCGSVHHPHRATMSEPISLPSVERAEEQAETAKKKENAGRS